MCTFHTQVQQEELAMLEAAGPTLTLLVAELESSSGVSRIFSTSSSKAWLMATFALALVSTNRHPCLLASACPSSLETSLAAACMCGPMLVSWRIFWGASAGVKAKGGMQPTSSTLLPTMAFTAPCTVEYMSTSRIQMSLMLSNVSRLVTSYATETGRHQSCEQVESHC